MKDKIMFLNHRIDVHGNTAFKIVGWSSGLDHYIEESMKESGQKEPITRTIVKGFMNSMIFPDPEQTGLWVLNCRVQHTDFPGSLTECPYNDLKLICGQFRRPISEDFTETHCEWGL